MATQSQANFAQPPSLVKYSNPVLVSTAGKKQNKVLGFSLRIKSTPKIWPVLTPRTSSIPSCPPGSTPLRNSSYGTKYPI